MAEASAPCGQWSAPPGWVIKTYKHMNIPNVDFWDTEVVLNDIVKNPNRQTDTVTGTRDIAYGTYDRIQLSAAEAFSALSVESNRHNWFGSSQSILLFRLSDEGRVFQWGRGESDKRSRVRAVRTVNGVEQEQRYCFFAISFCYISDRLRNADQSPFQETLDKCRREILRWVELFNEQLEMENARLANVNQPCIHEPVLAEVFGSLSTAELVILWSAKQYTDILYLVSCIRDMQWRRESDGAKYSVFRTTYTISSFPDLAASDDPKQPSEEKDKKRLREILGDAYIQFATQDTAGWQGASGFREYMEQCLNNASAYIGENGGGEMEVKLKRSAGEYDLVAKVSSRYLPPLFCYPTSLVGKHDPIEETEMRRDEWNFNVHHPKFNHYILYSSTRLTYLKTDLPHFVWDEQDVAHGAWETKLKEMSVLTIPEQQGGSAVTARSGRIKKIHEERIKELRKLQVEIVHRIPAVSNLAMELKQVFSDYIQCCCSSADYLWIEDFDTLFQQTLERISQYVNDIDIWMDRDTTDPLSDRHHDARRSMREISDLLRALTKQISHISTSNKLFFREQEMHFGYTAQHDLVIHAYYGIIKYLIAFIYGYTDRTRQSPLYPLVNFQPDNRITSLIYTEESAELFMKYKQIRPRIMVIHVPLDGVDDLMYYLPMLVHEVYHYAAPHDRAVRNLALAKVAVFQTLRFSMASCFADTLREQARAADAEEALQKAKLNHALVLRFDALVAPVLAAFLEEHADALSQGLDQYYFRTKKHSEELRAQAKACSILREWFVNWLREWLQDGLKREGVKSDPDSGRFDNLSDLFPALFYLLHDELAKAECPPDVDQSKYEQVYAAALAYFRQELDRAYSSTGKAVSAKDTNLAQEMMAYSVLYADHPILFRGLMKQMDEIFPDMAMVTLMRMTAAGYMLQIALDMDKQFYGSREYESDHIRFGAVLHWLLKRQLEQERNRQTGTPNQTDVEEELQKLWQAEQKTFRTLYISSYLLALQNGYTVQERSMLRPDMDKLAGQAEDWCCSFRQMYSAYRGHLGVSGVREAAAWIDDLIASEMVPPALTLDQELEERRKTLFEDPYHQYLRILNPDPEGKVPTQVDQARLFSLSIQTIMSFQQSQTLSELNEMLPDRRDETRKTLQKTAQKQKWRQMPRSGYVSVIPSPDQYEHSIQLALELLYRFREADGLPEATGMWYRGVSHADYPVLPSGFVHFGEDAGLLNGGVKDDTDQPFTFLQAAIHHYEAFRYSTEGTSADITPSRYYSTINYLTLMQHYSQHTNLLDWSEDFFASTYFALEDEINLNDRYEHEQRPGKREDYLLSKDYDAALYILDPIRFNLACQEIEAQEDGLFAVKPFAPHRLRDMIPNLSIKENQRTFREYHDLYSVRREQLKGVLRLRSDQVPLDGPLGKKPLDVSLLLMKKYWMEKLDIHLPRAVYAAKLNSRIRAQSGLFVAFSLRSAPAVWNDARIPTDQVSAGMFSYQSLERIQDYYVEAMGKKPFLMKIVIPAAMKQELGNLYYELGLSKERIYPEMQNQRNR